MMEGFTLSLALVDALPVLFFAASMAIIAGRFNSPLFVVGVILSVAAGCCKVLWKLILGIRGKNIQWLNRIFLPTQCAGFLLILIGIVLRAEQIQWGGLLGCLTSLPAALFFVLWIGLMGFMGWFRKNRFHNTARDNWIAQIVNTVAQLSLLIGIWLAA